MEPVLPTLLAMSLLFNFFQHEKIEAVTADSLIYKEAAEYNYIELEKAIKVGEENATLVTNINTELIQCVEKLKESKESQTNFERIAVGLEIDLKELEDKLSLSDWGITLIPSDLEF